MKTQLNMQLSNQLTSQPLKPNTPSTFSTLPLNHLSNQPITISSQEPNHPTNHTTSHLPNQPSNQPSNHLTNHSTNQLSNHPTNQLSNYPTNHPTDTQTFHHTTAFVSSTLASRDRTAGFRNRRDGVFLLTPAKVDRLVTLIFLAL